jgi:hypothetical protein
VTQEHPFPIKTMTCPPPIDIPLESISFLLDDILFVGSDYSLSISYFPQNATNKTVSFTSSDENILSVGESGTLDLKGKGLVTISVQSQDGQIEFSKDVAVYQIVNKPNVIKTSEQWRPFELIDNKNGEIGVESGWF